VKWAVQVQDERKRKRESLGGAFVASLSVGNHEPSMIPRLFLLPVLLFIPAVYGSALTVAISANEQQCYYADVDKPKEKIGVCPFIFQVQPS
jgi:hypothetical protein